MSPVQSQRTVTSRLARMVVAVTVVACSAAVGFVASKVWPLPWSRSAVSDASLLTAVVSTGSPSEKAAQVDAGPAPAFAGSQGEQAEKSGVAAVVPTGVTPPPVAAETPAVSPASAAVETAQEVQASPAPPAEKKVVTAAPAEAADAPKEAENKPASESDRATRSGESRRSRRGRLAPTSVRNKPRSKPATFAQSTQGNFQHDYTLRDFMSGSSPKH